MRDLVFLLLSFLTLGSALVVSFSTRIIYSGFALLGTFLGAAGFFILLSSDLVAITQILIYVGGIAVLILFAIMLTSKMGDVKLTNQSINYKFAVPTIGALAIFLVSLLTTGPWLQNENETFQSLVKPIGNALLSDYLLPFEVISFVLLGALIGALVLVRREVK